MIQGAFIREFGGLMSKKYSIIYKRSDELVTFVNDMKAKTDEEARGKFEKQHPDWTVVSVDER